MAFEVPRAAGNHPRLLVAILIGALAAGGAAAVWLRPAPEAVAAYTESGVAAYQNPPRPPLQVVEDLPLLAARLRQESAEGRFMGAVLVARGDRIVFRQTYGMANYERQQPMALDTRFRLASLSKQVTAAAILRLQDQGVLSVEDPVCHWIQPCPPQWAAIRIKNLISHTAGIPDLMARPGWGAARMTPKTPEQLTAESAAYSLSFTPGEKISYNNAGFNLAGVIVEKASGKPYFDFLRDEFFAPLGMKDTGYDNGSVDRLAMGYADFAQGLTPQPRSNAGIVFAAGALYSTLDDMLVWQRALHHGGVVEAASYADMIADHAPADTPLERGRPRRDWGYGLFVNDLGHRVEPAFDARQIYHTGSWAGFRNLVTYEPDQDVTVIVLSNNYHQTAKVLLISQQAMAEALDKPFPITLAK